MRTINTNVCTGCDDCAGSCPVDAIELCVVDRRLVYEIQDWCIDCGLCEMVCTDGAISECSDGGGAG